MLVENSSGQPPESKEAASWKESLSLTYPVLADIDGEFFSTYGGGDEVFVFYLIDRDGVIVWQETREGPDTLQRIRDQVETLLAK